MLSNRKFFWCPDRCDYWGFQLKCLYGYQELRPRLGYELAGLGVSTERREARYFIGICLVPWKGVQCVRRGHSRRSATELGI